VSLVSISACSGADSVMVLSTVADDGFANRGADGEDVDAAYCRDRAIEDKQALAPGYYVDPPRPIAQSRFGLARRGPESKIQKVLLRGKGSGERMSFMIIGLSVTTYPHIG